MSLPIEERRRRSAERMRIWRASLNEEEYQAHRVKMRAASAKHRAKNRERLNAENRLYRLRNAEKERLRWVPRLYGITREKYEELMAKPCALCGGTSTDMDHDHETGKVRAALCRRCNLGLGFYGDDPEKLEAAARYLRSHKDVYLPREFLADRVAA